MAEEERDDQQDLTDDSEDKGENILDEVTIQGLDDDVEEDEPEDEKEKSSEKTKPPEGEELTKIKSDLDRATKKINDLNKALHEERQAKKGKKEDEAPALSKAEMKKLYDEYKDDPDTIFQLIDYMVNQAAKGASKEVIDKNKVAENKKETEAYLQKTFPDLYNEESEFRKAVDKTKAEMGFVDHPYGDFVGSAIQTMLNLPHLAKNFYDKGRSDALSGKAEKTRKEIIKESGLTPKGKGKAETQTGKLSDKHLAVADKLNLSPNARKVLQKITNASTVSVEG